MKFFIGLCIIFTVLISVADDRRIVLLDTSSGGYLQSFFSSVFSGKNPCVLPEDMNVEIKRADWRNLKISDDFSVVADEGLHKFDRSGFRVLNYAVLPLIFAVDAANPLESISTEDLRRICTGKIASWQRLGGKDVKVTLVSGPVDSPVGRVWRKMLMLQDLEDIQKNDISTYITPDLITVSTIEGQLAMVNMPGVMVAGSWQLAVRQDKKYKILKVNNVYPSEKNILDGSYTLVARYALLCKKDSTPAGILPLLEFIRSAAAADGNFLASATVSEQQ